MERVDRRDERLHRLVGVRAQLVQPSGQGLIVMELAYGYTRQSGLGWLVRSHAGVGRQPREGRQLAVGQGPEKVDDRSAVAGISEQRIALCGNRVLNLTSFALGTIGERCRLLKVVHERKQ